MRLPTLLSASLSAALACMAAALPAAAQTERSPGASIGADPAADARDFPGWPQRAISDQALARSLPGFDNHYAMVDGVRIHYVAGGMGTPVFLLPGWPETWWAYHKIMPALAQTHRVISIDYRGMGSSDKPLGGYDKKTMAGDIAELARRLGYAKIDVVGHDIGAMVAFSLAANHPQLVSKLAMLETTHPSPGYLEARLLPDDGTFGDKIDPKHPYLWWVAFNQVQELPEQLLEGRAGIEQAWVFRYLTQDETSIDARSRAVYAAAYGTRDGIRASNGWYRAFGQDIKDYAGYAKLSIPVLGLAGPSYAPVKAALEAEAPGSQTYQVRGSGHFIAEEKPAVLIAHLRRFLDGEGSLPD